MILLTILAIRLWFFKNILIKTKNKAHFHWSHPAIHVYIYYTSYKSAISDGHTLLSLTKEWNIVFGVILS